MATANQNAQGLVLALFNASAGGNLANLAPLASTASATNALGSNLVAVAALVTGKNLSDNTTFRDTLLANLQITSTNSAYANAKAWVDGQLATPGTDKGTIAGTAVTYLLSLTDATNPYYSAAKTFQARNDAAVTWSTSSAGSAVLSATALIAQQASVDNYVAPPPPPVGDINIALIAGKDTVSGGAGNETISGAVSNLAANKTLDATDVIDGGAGTNTLKLDFATSWNGFTTGSVTNVQNVILNNVGGDTLSFDGTGTTGVTTYTLNTTGNNGVTNLQNLATGVQTINLNGQKQSADTTFTTSFVSTAPEASGTADALTLNINGVGTKARSGSTAPVQTKITLGSIEAINLGVTGANVISLLSGNTGASSITVKATGAGTLAIDSVPVNLTSFDASAMTGAVTGNLSAVISAASITKIATGSGADTLTVDLADIRSTAVVAMGDGSDKLIINNSKTTSGVASWTTTGVETLAFNNIPNSG
jgi:hypothetical protein